MTFFQKFFGAIRDAHRESLLSEGKKELNSNVVQLLMIRYRYESVLSEQAKSDLWEAWKLANNAQREIDLAIDETRQAVREGKA